MAVRDDRSDVKQTPKVSGDANGARRCIWQKQILAPSLT
jgi:hypothetical protein